MKTTSLLSTLWGTSFAVLSATTASATTFTMTEDTLGTDDLFGQSIDLTVDGITTTVSGTSDDSFLQVDGDGIFLQGTNTLVNFVFDMPVTVTGYGIGFNNGGVAGSIDFLSSGGDSSLAEPGITTGTYSLGTPLNLLVGQTLTVDSSLNNVSQMNTLTVEPFEAPQATPEPATLIGLLLVGSVGLLSKRQKQES